MRVLFTGLLLALLVGAVVAFVVIGIRQRLRRRRLAAQCQNLGLEFTPIDPFDVAKCFFDFVLISAGHSGRAENVAHGRIGGNRLRVFDFLYEIGHGIRRVVRRYSVVIVEPNRRLADVLMWNENDLHSAPLAVGEATQPVGPWICSGDDTAARRLADAAGNLAQLAASMQVVRDTLLVCAPARGLGGVYGQLLEAVGDLCGHLSEEEGPAGLE